MRPRKHDRHLPACVYLRSGTYYYVQGGKWTAIGKTLQIALAEYARIANVPGESMSALIDRAMPAIVRDVSDSTAKQYQYAARVLRGTFAEFRPSDVRPSDVVRMLDDWQDSPATGQRLLVVLKAVFQWALMRDEVLSNPCAGVKRPPPLRRDRLILPGEYAAIYAQADPLIQCVMDLCRLTGQRIGDVLSLKRAQLEDGGIRFVQAKTGQELVVAWSPELRSAVARVKSLPGRVLPMTLFARDGHKLRYEYVWRAFKAAADRAGVENVRPHDLRALAATEANRQGLDASALLGHKSARTTEVYLRDKTPKTVSPPAFAVPKKKARAR